MKCCTIRIVDEVNCKVEGLETVDVRKCVNALKFRVPYAQHLPSVKFGRWDGTVSYFSVGGGTQINLLDKILPVLEDAGYTFDIKDERVQHNFEFEKIDEGYNSDRLWPANHPLCPNLPIMLRSDQADIVNGFLENLHGVMSIPTGGGKTIVTATLSRIVEKYGRTLVIVPNKNLVRQTCDDYKLLGLDVGVYFGDQKDWGKTHTICTWQSLNVLLDNSKAADPEDTIQEFLKGVTAVIVDECHQAKADILRKLLSGVLKNVPIRWGLTGTIPKTEYEWYPILGCVGPVIKKISVSDYQEQNVLSKCDIDILQTQDIRKFNMYQDEYDYLTSDPTRIEWLGDLVGAIAQDGNTLVLVQRIETGKKLSKHLPDSVFISGNVKVEDRQEEYNEIATEDNRIIIATYGVAAVGINIPRIFNVVLVEPGKSFVRTIQSIGRGLRRAQDKDYVRIFDVCSSCKYSKRHLTERKKFYKESGYPHKVTKVDI